MSPILGDDNEEEVGTMSGSAGTRVISLKDALIIHNNTRATFKRGLKSSNKLYTDPGRDADTEEMSDLFEFGSAPGTPQKYATRFKKAFQSMQVQALQSKTMEQIPLPPSGSQLMRAGSYLAQKADTAPETLAGNCSEMAIYAAMLVSCKTTDGIYIVQLQRPGDHIFCLLSTSPPTPCAIRDLPKQSLSWSIIIDPWLNICCLAFRYPERVAAQLDEWAKSGKRVLAHGKWWHPTGTYKQSFLSSSFTLKPYR
jgi:hypothetical protein